MQQPKIKWQDLEKLVRMVAESKFGGVAKAETVAGVKCDCVIRLADGSVILVEISKEDTITKLRTDIAKFQVLRNHFLQQNIFPRCFFITLVDPTAALIDAGRANFVTTYSAIQFFNAMLGVENYANLRKRHSFGSAVDLYSGEPDSKKYVHVSYYSQNGECYSAEKIASELIRGKTIVLIGDYGSGKSRCVKEVFESLHESRPQHFRNAIAINLRDNWGLKRAPEIITRHFEDLGLGGQVPDTLKVAFGLSTVYLLDGFDEIGAQTWSDDPTKLVEIRKQSLVGVKDLILKAKGGLLLTGREHYFNNDAELIECLGLEGKSPLFLRCNQELTSEQFSEMLGRKTGALPDWMPKKPLIAAIIRDIDPMALDGIFQTSSGEIDFWELLIDTFCEREAKINPILDSSIIRALYTRIGRLSRMTETSLGPISIKQINEAFEQTTSRPPTDESAIILQRLPGLGRIGAESLDRQFVDSFILDGLKAEDVLQLFGQGSVPELNQRWIHSVESFGAYFIATKLSVSNQVITAAAFIKRHKEAPNRMLLSDILVALLTAGGSPIDMGGLFIQKCKFHHVSIADTSVQNLQLDDSHFNFLDLTDADPINLKISDSTITRISGVAAIEHLPAWVTNCLVDDFQGLNTLTAIREAGLTMAQTFLLSSLRKLFLQPGAGRKESSMYKGYGSSAEKKICEKVIALLLHEHFCERHKGTTETLYLPNRSLTGRVRSITSQMTSSKDDLWLKVTKIK